MCVFIAAPFPSFHFMRTLKRLTEFQMMHKCEEAVEQRRHKVVLRTIRNPLVTHFHRTLDTPITVSHWSHCLDAHINVFLLHYSSSSAHNHIALYFRTTETRRNWMDSFMLFLTSSTGSLTLLLHELRGCRLPFSDSPHIFKTRDSRIQCNCWNSVILSNQLDKRKSRAVWNSVVHNHHNTRVCINIILNGYYLIA